MRHIDIIEDYSKRKKLKHKDEMILQKYVFIDKIM